MQVPEVTLKSLKKLFSSGSIDEYKPSCRKDSSDEDSSDPLFPHRPNEIPVNNDILNDNVTETINETKRDKKRSQIIDNWKKVKINYLKTQGKVTFRIIAKHWSRALL